MLVSYIITMVFTVSIGVITYYSALNVVKKDAMESNLSNLKQSSEIINTHLKEVESVVAQIGFNPMIVSVLGSQSSRIEVQHPKAIEVWKYIQTYRFTSDFIRDFYITMNKSEIIISPTYLSLRLKLFYERSLQYSGMTFEQWREEFLNQYHASEYLPARQIKVNGNRDSYITYIQTLPFGSQNNITGTLIVLIEESKIQKLLNPEGLQEGGWFYIANAEGEILTSMSGNDGDMDMLGVELTGTEGFDQFKLAGQDMLVSYYTSPINEWKYVSAIPKSVVMKKVNAITETNTMILVIGLFIGIGIAIFFSNRHSKPVRKLIHKFGEAFSLEQHPESNEYHILDHSISRLIRNNEALNSEIDKQTPLLTAALFDRLFRGEFNDDAELAQALSDIRLSIAGSWFVVVVLRMEWLDETNHDQPYETANAKRAIIKELISRELGDRGFIHDLRQERIALLLKFAGEGEADRTQALDEFIHHISTLLNKHSDIKVSFGAGSIYGQLLDVYRSFNEASTAIELANPGRDEYIIRYKDIPKGNGSYCYPMEIEQRMINLVKSGNQNEVRKLLSQINTEVIASLKSSSDRMKPLLYDISATVYKLVQDVSQLHGGEKVLDYDEFLEHLITFYTFDEAFGYITQTLLDICESVNKQKRSHNTELKDSIIAYIQENFMDGRLCLASVADQYQINEVYLSQFFKEQTGENFSGYLERVRMNLARELLIEDKLTVEEIARQVGYLNSNTFYKAFKRIEGVSPRAFKNK